jgi:hypothetical protein
MKRTGPKKSPQPVRSACHWLHVPILPSPAAPQGWPGLLWIEAETQRGQVGDVYMLTPLADLSNPPGLVGWRLTRSDGTRHDIDGTFYSCTCRDSQSRPRACKHVKALQAALLAIGVHIPAEMLAEARLLQLGDPSVSDSQDFDNPPGRGPDRAA